MIIKESVLKCVDNSGAKTIRCISLLTSADCRYATVGHIIKIVVEKYKKRKQKPHINDRDYKKSILDLKNTFFALIISVNKKNRRFGSFFFKSKRNRAVLLTKSRELFATRIKGYAVKELGNKKFLKLYSPILLAASYIV